MVEIPVISPLLYSLRLISKMDYCSLFSRLALPQQSLLRVQDFDGGPSLPHISEKGGQDADGLVQVEVFLAQPTLEIGGV